MFVARGDVSRSMTQHLERMPHAATLAKLFDAPPCPDLLLHPSWQHPRRSSRGGAAPDAPWPADAANVILLHENEEALEPHLGE
jgi:hypothetical protein